MGVSFGVSDDSRHWIIWSSTPVSGVPCPTTDVALLLLLSTPFCVCRLHFLPADWCSLWFPIQIFEEENLVGLVKHHSF